MGPTPSCERGAAVTCSPIRQEEQKGPREQIMEVSVFACQGHEHSSDGRAAENQPDANSVEVQVAQVLCTVLSGCYADGPAMQSAVSAPSPAPPSPTVWPRCACSMTAHDSGRACGGRCRRRTTRCGCRIGWTSVSCLHAMEGRGCLSGPEVIRFMMDTEWQARAGRLRHWGGGRWRSSTYGGRQREDDNRAPRCLRVRGARFPRAARYPQWSHASLP